MATDSLDPVGIYFGTRSGKLYASKDAGQSWREVLNGLPQIVCVASAVVAELAGDSSPGPTVERKRVSPKKVKPSKIKGSSGKRKRPLTPNSSRRETGKKGIPSRPGKGEKGTRTPVRKRRRR